MSLKVSAQDDIGSWTVIGEDVVLTYPALRNMDNSYTIDSFIVTAYFYNGLINNSAGFREKHEIYKMGELMAVTNYNHRIDSSGNFIPSVVVWLKPPDTTVIWDTMFDSVFDTTLVTDTLLDTIVDTIGTVLPDDGDMNGDGKVNMKDVFELWKKVFGLR